MNERRTFSSPLLWSLIGLVIFFLVIGGFVMKMLLWEDDFPTQRKITTVNLVKPPHTPVKKTPEPEPPKEKQPPRETLDHKQEATRGESYTTEDPRMKSDDSPAPQAQSHAHVSKAIEGPAPPVMGPGAATSEASSEGGGGGPPAGDTIGLDAVGTGGGDAFGLVARRGGRSITSGGGSGRGTGTASAEAGPVVAHKAPVSKPAPKVFRIGGNPMGKADGGGGGGTEIPLLEKYGWYTDKVKGEVTAHIRKQVEENRQIPKGKFQTVIRISIDSLGAVIDTQIIGSSGNQEMDEMVKRSIANLTITEPPPEGMPKTLVIRVTSQSG